MRSPEEIAKEALRSGLEHLRLNAFGSWESDLIEGVAAAIREDRAEMVSEEEVKAAFRKWCESDVAGQSYKSRMRLTLEAARKARAG